MAFLRGVRGELTTKQIIIISILIVSFIIVLVFWASFSWTATTEKEICHNSVVMRGAVPGFKELVALKCTTKKVCISASASSCKDGKSYDEVLKVDSTVKLREELINLLYDCWWMMGEGKVDYRSASGGDFYCTICSHIDFDESVHESFGNVSYISLYQTMAARQVPNAKVSYLKYLYNTDSIADVALRLAKAKDSSDNDNPVDLNSAKIDTTKDYSIVTGVFKEGISNLAGAGIGAGGGAAAGLISLFIVSNPIGWIVGGIAIGATVGYFVVSSSGQVSLSPVLVEYESTAINDIGCKAFDNTL